MPVKKSDLELMLLAGLPIPIDDFGELYLPTLKQIIQLRQSKYNEYLSALLFDKKNLQNMNDEIDGYSNYEVAMSFIYHDQLLKNSFLNAIKLFFHQAANQNEEGLIYLGDPQENRMLTEEKFCEIQQILKLANYIKEPEEDNIEAGNDRAKQFMESLKKKKERLSKMQKEKMNFHSLMSALAWKTNGIENVLDLTVYQLYDAFYRLEGMENYHYTLTGIYTGNIDGKKVKLPDIHWANIIKLK